jgi:hypothetical protein
LGIIVSSVKEAISPVSAVAENCSRDALAEARPKTAAIELNVRNLTEGNLRLFCLLI